MDKSIYNANVPLIIYGQNLDYTHSLWYLKHIHCFTEYLFYFSENAILLRCVFKYN